MVRCTVRVKKYLRVMSDSYSREEADKSFVRGEDFEDSLISALKKSKQMVFFYQTFIPFSLNTMSLSAIPATSATSSIPFAPF